MSEITPSEFVRDDYHEKIANGECIVWYDSISVTQVDKKENLYWLYDYERGYIGHAAEEDRCLIVEDTRDLEALRQRLRETWLTIIEQCDHGELIALRIEMEHTLRILRT
jgi:hypothetical protein